MGRARTSPRCTRCSSELGIELFPSYREGEPRLRRPDGHEPTATRATTRPLGAGRRAAFEAADAKLDALAQGARPRGALGPPRRRASSTRSPSRPGSGPRCRRAGARPAPLLARRRLPDQARPHVLAAAGAVDDRGRRRHLRAVRARAVPRLPRRRRLAADLAAARRAARRPRSLLDAPARAIRWSDDGVEIDAGAVTVVARAAIVAVPPNLTDAIHFDPALPPGGCGSSQALSQGSDQQGPRGLRRARSGATTGSPDRGSRPTSSSASSTTTRRRRPPPGCSCTFLAGENAERAGRLSAAERRGAVLEGMAKYVGPRALAASRRDRDRLVGAGVDARRLRGRASASAGSTRFGADLRRPVGPIHWACTDIAGVGHMHMEGAIRSGREAARAILAA